MMWLFATGGLVLLGVGAFVLLKQHTNQTDIDREAATFEIIE